MPCPPRCRDAIAAASCPRPSCPRQLPAISPCRRCQKSQGKIRSNDWFMMVDPLEAKCLAAKQLQEIQAKEILRPISSASSSASAADFICLKPGLKLKLRANRPADFSTSATAIPTPLCSIFQTVPRTMSSGGVSSAAGAAAAVQTKDRSGHPNPQPPSRLSMPWNRPRTTGDCDSLPEWKLNCLCSEQGLLSPTVKGGIHIGGGWF